MCEAFRDPDRAVATAGKCRRGPLAKCGRTAPQIDGHVEYLPRQRGDQLSLWLAHLIVQATQHVAHRERLVVLHELWIESSRFLEDPPVIAFKEKSAMVLKDARLED